MTMKIAWAIGACLLVGISVLTTTLVIKNSDPLPAPSPSPSQIRAIYPSSVPDGYRVDKTSLSETREVATYTITTPAKDTVLVSIQQKPSDAVLEKFETEQLGLPETINNITVGQVRGRVVASFTKDSQWILLNAPPTVSYNVLAEIAAEF